MCVANPNGEMLKCGIKKSMERNENVRQEEIEFLSKVYAVVITISSFSFCVAL